MPGPSPDATQMRLYRLDPDGHPSVRHPRRRNRESAAPSPEHDQLVLAAFDALAGQLDFGVMILGESRLVTYSNEAARQALASRTDFGIRRGVLSTTHVDLAALLSRPRSGRQGMSFWTYTLGSHDDQLVLHRPRLRRADDPEMLLLYAPRRRRMIPGSLLRCMYGLTAAEADLTGRLVAGDDLVGAAVSLGVSIHTVRTHLKKIFGKLEVRSQADLVRLLLSGPVTPD